MAEESSLLLRIKGDSSGAKQAASETRAAIASLRQQAAPEFAALEKLGANALSSFSNQLSIFSSQQIPLFTNALGQLTPALQSVATEGTEAGASLGAMAGPIGIAAAAALALTAAAIGLTKEFIDLTVSTAEWEGKLQDLSQQVGISTETLSALEVLAKTTGGSIEGITASLGIFQKKLEEAQDPESKSAALLKSLGIETNNTEEAFRQAITALAGMEEGYHQTATALELFGRGGKSVLAIIKETNGDLDTAIVKFREMGLVVSEEDAKAADAFNDQLAVIQFQLRATTALLVRDAIPQILSVLKQVSQILKENRDAVEAVGSAINIFVKGNIGILVGTLKTLELVLQGVRDSWLAMKAALAGALTGRIDIIMTIFQQFKQQQQTLSALGAADAGQGLQGESFFGGVEGGFSAPQARTAGARAAATAKVSAGQRLLNSLIDEYNRLTVKELELTRLAAVGLELEKDEYKKLTPELEGKIKAEAFLIDVLNERTKAQKEAVQADKVQADAEAAFIEKLDRQAKERTNLEERIAEAVQQQREALAELEGFEKTHLQTVEEYIADAVKQAEAVGGVTDKMKEYFALLIKIAAKEDEIEANRKKFEGVLGGAGGGTSQRLSNQIQQIQILSGAYQELFSSIGQGVGQVVQDFVLLGQTGPAVMRRILASALATVAAQAAAQAIYELALGFAALTPWGAAIYGPAPLHFKAAALFGSIAAVTAIAGRGIAGNTFNQGGGGPFGGGGNQGGNQSLAPIITARNQQPQKIYIVIRPDGTKFAEAVTAHVLDDMGNAGPIREVISNDRR